MENVYRRGKSWVTCVQVQGRRIRRAYRTKPEALKAAYDLKQVRNYQKRGDLPKDISLAFFKTRFKEFIQSKAKQTQYRDLDAFTKLESAFPIRWLRDITPERLDVLKGKLLNQGTGRPAINRALKSLKAAMRKAEGWNLIGKQDWTTVKLLETPKSRLLFYTLEELGRLEVHCKGPYLAAFHLGYEAGLRPLEKRKLRREDIFWDIHKLRIWNSKGTRSRWVPMTERLEVFLKAYPMGQASILGDDLPSGDAWSAYWKAIAKRASLKGSEYTLRHTFASHYIMAGGKIEILKEIMGHSSITMTMVYVHLSQDAMDQDIKRLPAPVAVLCTADSISSPYNPIEKDMIIRR